MSENGSKSYEYGLSVKLKKNYKKFGYKAVFKSSRNLKEHLTTKNKPKLPDNSQPDDHKLSCTCGKNYISKTKLKISSRLEQHFKSTIDGKWERPAVSEHSKSCPGSFNWHSKDCTLKVQRTDF